MRDVLEILAAEEVDNSVRLVARLAVREIDKMEQDFKEVFSIIGEAKVQLPMDKIAKLHNLRIKYGK